MNSNNVEQYGWQGSHAPHTCDYLVPDILRHLSGVQAKHVLDLGCGNGALCHELSSHGYHVVGVDNDKQGVEISTQNYPEISFYQFGVEDDPALLLASTKPFDAVVSTEVIEHLYSPDLLVQYAKAVLKEKGWLVITTPYHGYIKNLALSIFNKWDTHMDPLWHGGHIKLWSRNTITKLLSDNGFTVTEFSGAGRIPFLWKSMVLVAQKNMEPD